MSTLKGDILSQVEQTHVIELQLNGYTHVETSDEESDNLFNIFDHTVYRPLCIIIFASIVWPNRQYAEIDYRSSHRCVDSMERRNKLDNMNVLSIY